MLTKRLCGLFLALTLLLSISIPALAADEPQTPSREEAASAAASLAAQYGGATSLQYAVWQNGKVTLTGHTGVYSKTENRPITTDTLYGIGSISKIYTTAAVMKLVEAGKVTLDAPVTRYLPRFKMADERYKQITVRMLLNHSSGLMGSSTNNAFLFADSDQSATKDLLARLATQGLKSAPGSIAVYCNDGFTLAELLVEAVSGSSFTAFVRQQVLTPAGLLSTFTPQDKFDTTRLAKIYESATETRALPQETLGVIGTGGIYASASDLAAFGGALLNGSLLSAASTSAMQNAEYQRGIWPSDDADSIAYGLGWDSVKAYPFATSGIQALSKGGDTIYYHASLVVLPAYKIAVAVLSSGGVSTYNQQAATQMLLATLKEQGVSVDQTPLSLPASTPAAMPSSMLNYAGYYGNVAQQMKLNISSDGVLTLHMSNAPSAPDQVFHYYNDGSFRDQSGAAYILKFVKEVNGQTYLYQKNCTALPGLGYLPMSQYVAQKLPANEISPELQAKWDSLDTLPMLPVNMKYSSVVYMLLMQQLSSAEKPEKIPGYLSGLRIVDETSAQSLYEIPNAAGRDTQTIKLYKEDGVLHYSTPQNMIWRDASDLSDLYARGKAYCTVGENGYARWFSIAEADAGRHMTVQVPKNSGFYVYDETGKITASSVVYGDLATTLPKGGLLVFSGEPGARFQLGFSS